MYRIYIPPSKTAIFFVAAQPTRRIGVKTLLFSFRAMRGEKIKIKSVFLWVAPNGAGSLRRP